MTFRTLLPLVVLLASCGVAEQPESSKSIAAYEVPLPTDHDKSAFLAILSRHAEDYGFHVDSATKAELDAMSQVSPITFSATVWRGDNDEESVASAMDFEDRIGRVWIGFSGEPSRTELRAFQSGIVAELKAEWPQTRELPIMPNGAIPLTDDLIVEGDRYVVRPSAASKYAEARQ